MPVEPRLNPYRPLVVGAVLLALAFVLHTASRVFIPISLGILLTFILTPAVSLLQSRGLRRTPSVLLVVLATAVFASGMATALGVQLRDLAQDLPAHKGHVTRKIHDLVGEGPGVFDNLSKMLDEISTEMESASKTGAPKSDVAIPVRVQPERAPRFGLLSLIAGPFAGTLGAFSLTIALTISMLLMREDLRNRLFVLLGDGHLTSTTRALDEVSTRISKYLLTQVILNSAFGALFGIGLAVIGVKYALVWGVLAAVLRFVPYVGTWLAAVFPVIVSLAAEGWVQPIAVVIWVVFLGVLANNILEPMLVSRSTGVTPIALVVATAFWTWLWGPIGLVLSTPITVCLSVVGKYVPSLRFLDVLLGSAAPLGAEVKFYQRLLARDEIEAADLVEECLLTQTPEQLFEGLILPALARARVDHERGNLTEAELQALINATREILDEALGAVEEGPGETVLLACPAHDALDALAVECLARLVGPGVAKVKIAPAESTAAEVLARAEEAEPAVVCVGMFPPAGGARARYLCKKLRAKYPQLPIVVGMWGPGDEQLTEHLKAAGATQVAATLGETRGHVVPLLKVAPHLESVGVDHE